MKAVIVGGGISGLAAAYYLTRHQALPEVMVLEASPRWGGIIHTEYQDGFCLEAGPDSFVRHKKETEELCRELGLASSLISNNLENQRSYCWFDGRLHPLPRVLNPPIDLKEIVESSLLSEGGRSRAALEPTVPAASGEELSVAGFIRRRFGPEVAERIFEPLVAGVFGGSAEEISLTAAFPQLIEHEQRYGCLTAGKPSKGSRGTGPAKVARPIFGSLGKGMGQLTCGLVESLQGSAQLHSSSPVFSVGRKGKGFEVRLDDGASILADLVVLATSAPVSARLLQQGGKRIARCLGRIEYAPAILACLGYRSRVVDIAGSGWIAPPGCGHSLLACSWAHQKFAGRCPQGHSLLRAYLSGSTAADLMSLPEQEIVRIVRHELKEAQGIASRPVVERVYRLPLALPLYKVGHPKLIARLKELLQQTPGLFCIGNYLDGVGISDCLRQARGMVSGFRL